MINTSDLIPKGSFISEPSGIKHALIIMLAVIFLVFIGVSGYAYKQKVTEVKVIKVNPPVITQCQRLSMPDCKPATNGELYECTLTIQKNLNLCADQVDALVRWQKQSLIK